MVPQQAAALVIDTYDPEIVFQVTGQSMQELGLVPAGTSVQSSVQVSEVGATISVLDSGSGSPASSFLGFLPTTPVLPTKVGANKVEATKVGATKGLKMPSPRESKGKSRKETGNADRLPGPVPKLKNHDKSRRSSKSSPAPAPAAGAHSHDQATVAPVLHQSFAEVSVQHENPGSTSESHVNLSQVLASFSSFQEQMQLQMAQQRQEMLEQRAHLEGQLAQFQGIVENLAQPQGDSISSQTLPPVDSLPPFDPANPWRPALYAPFAEGFLTIEGLGTRPIADFERFPQNAELPYCYVRLSDDATFREDRVPRETVLYSRDRAQSCLIKELKEIGCTNSRLLPHNASLTIFQTPLILELPFASKVITAVHQALKEDKASPKLREEESTSLLLPGESDPWIDIQNTFTVGKLSLNAASEQFNEDLPPLTDSLVKAEFEAKSRFARTLHTFTLLELTVLQNPSVEFLKVILKSMVASLRYDAFAFGEARRKCRKYVLHTARIRHEPSRLINSSSFGEHLFPNNLVQEVIEAASKTNQSLRTRWDIPSKRKHVEGHGPQPKNRPTSKIPKVHQTPAQMIPVTASTSAASQQFVLVPSPTPSPVHHPPFERQSSFRAPGFSYQFHGRKAARGRSTPFQRGQGRSQTEKRTRSRSQSQRRGRGRGASQ